MHGNRTTNEQPGDAAGGGLARQTDFQVGSWAALALHCAGRSEAEARRLGLPAEDAEDATQDALLALFARAGEIYEPQRWLAAAIRFRLVSRVRELIRIRRHADQLSRTARGSASNPSSQPDWALEVDDSSHASAAARGLLLLTGLPAPYAQIADLQYLRGWPRARITDWLRRWRPVGENTCRRLFRRTHAMLKVLGAEGKPGPRTHWPLRFTSSRRSWNCTPPPPLDDF